MLVRTSLRTVIALCIPALLAACTGSGVQLSAARAEAAGAGAILIDATGAAHPDSLAPRAAQLVIPGVNACPGSMALARAGAELHAVWWQPRADSSAALLSAHSSDDGVTWSASVPVDTTDRGTTGCRRPPASLAADDRTGYVHVSYGMVAPEGVGLFFAHSMDRGRMFHSPVPIVYGERATRTAVAADGDHVAVAFEDPTSGTPSIGLALSRTMGHIFEERVFPVSDDNGAALHPLVSVSGDRVAVGWRGNGPAAGATVRVRTGRLP